MNAQTEISESGNEKVATQQKAGDGHCITEYKALKEAAEKLSRECPLQTYTIYTEKKLTDAERVKVDKLARIRSKAFGKHYGGEEVRSIKVITGQPNEVQHAESWSLLEDDNTVYHIRVCLDHAGWLFVNGQPIIELSTRWNNFIRVVVTTLEGKTVKYTLHNEYMN